MFNAGNDTYRSKKPCVSCGSNIFWKKTNDCQRCTSKNKIPAHNHSKMLDIDRLLEERRFDKLLNDFI